MTKQNNRFISLLLSSILLVCFCLSIPVRAVEPKKEDVFEDADRLAEDGKLRRAIQIWQQEAEIYNQENNLIKDAEVSLK